MKKNKTVVILDMDDTQFAALPRLENCLGRLMTDFAAAHGITSSQVENLVREAHGQHRFNDGAGLVDAIVEADPALRTNNIALSSAWKEAQVRIKQDWIYNSHQQTAFFPGVIECLKFWKDKGIKSVIQTDCEHIAVVRNLWMLGTNAVRSGDLESPEQILDLYDHIFCQAGISPSDDLLHSIDPTFKLRAEQKMVAWEDGLYKPSAHHARHMLDVMGAESKDVVYIGDSHKDGAEAKSILPEIDFVWAKYGTKIADKVLDLCRRVASNKFSYGELAISREMQDRQINPLYILENSMSEVLGNFEWGAEAKPLSQCPSLGLTYK